MVGGMKITRENIHFTFTCISTGGPATTVTWTRDSVTVTEGTETVLDDPVTAQYTHTLTVTGKTSGFYRCRVDNQQSHASLSLELRGKIHSYHALIRPLQINSCFSFHLISACMLVDFLNFLILSMRS